MDVMVFLFCALFVIIGLGTVIGSLGHIFNKLNVYNKRITCVIGVFSRREVSILIRNVDSVEFHKTFFGRIFNYGTIVICSSRRTFRFRMVANVEEIMSLIVNAQDLLEAELVQVQTNAIINAVGGNKVVESLSKEVQPVVNVATPVVNVETPAANTVIPATVEPVAVESIPEVVQKKCQHCGAVLEDDTKFCAECGHKVEE